MPTPSPHPASPPGPPAPEPDRAAVLKPRIVRLLTIASLALVTLGLYAPSVNHAFLNWDDPQYVHENRLTLGKQYGALLRAVVSHHYHPLTMWSLAWNVSSPLSPRPFHVTNVMLHVVNTLLVFLLTWMLAAGRLPVAFLVALLFGVHPMHVESVAWIAERKDVLYACFYLAGLIAYWGYLELERRPLLILAFVLFVLSCLAKGTAVTFPLAMLLLDYWKRRPITLSGALREKLPFFAVSILFGAIVLDVQGGGNLHGLLSAPARALPGVSEPATFDLMRRIATPAYGILVYVVRLFAPLELCALYPYPFAGGRGTAALVLGPLFVLLLAGLALSDLRRTRIIAFGVGWFLATVALSLQWVPVGPGITKSIPVGWAFTADRYTYLPYLGPCFILAMGLDAVWRRRRPMGVALWGVCAVFVALLMVQTRHQIATWRTSESLWSRTIDVHPGLALAYVYRGKDRDASGRVADAGRDFRTAFDLGLRSADVYEGLGSTSVAVGMLDSAAVQFDLAVRADPSRGRSYYNRAVVRLQLSRTREAVADLDTAIARLPGQRTMLLGVRGYAKTLLGDCRGAVADFDRSIAAGGRDPGVRYRRGECRLQLGDAAGAAEDFREALRLDPTYDKARARLRAMGG